MEKRLSSLVLREKKSSVVLINSSVIHNTIICLFPIVRYLSFFFDEFLTMKEHAITLKFVKAHIFTLDLSVESDLF